MIEHMIVQSCMCMCAVCGGKCTCMHMHNVCVCVSTPLPSVKVLPTHLFSMILCTILSVVSQLPLSTIFKMPICFGTCNIVTLCKSLRKVHTPQLDIPCSHAQMAASDYSLSVSVCLSVCAHSLFADDTNEDEDYQFYLQPEVLLLASQQILLTRSKESSSHEVL